MDVVSSRRIFLQHSRAGKSPPGRPPIMQDGRRVQVYLDQRSLEAAAFLGGGNVSAGIRAALSMIPWPGTSAQSQSRPDR